MLLTQCSHLFGKVSPKLAEEVATGQQVKGRVAPHGVKHEGVHSTGEAGHVTDLVLPVGCHHKRKADGLGDFSLTLLLNPGPSSLSEVCGKCETGRCHSARLGFWLISCSGSREVRGMLMREEELERHTEPSDQTLIRSRFCRKGGKRSRRG